MDELCLKVECFNLKYTLECGQCFRWKKVYEDDTQVTFIGIIKDRVIKITQKGKEILIKSSKDENLEQIVMDYFDLNTDYKKIEEEISKIDKNVNIAVKNSSGIRILNQDFFEMIMSYIISANNNIPRISKSILEISKRYGKKVEFEESIYYLFPTLSELLNVSEEDFKKCGVGFRARYLKNTLKYIKENNTNYIDMNRLDTVTLKNELMKMQGVGPKVAECIMLFSMKRKEVFPIDVWVERVMSKLYFKDLGGKVKRKDIVKYSEDNFKSYAGIVQEHLFMNIREKLL